MTWFSRAFGVALALWAVGPASVRPPSSSTMWLQVGTIADAAAAGCTTVSGSTACRDPATRTAYRIDVKDFGAKGDGAADDSAALAAAINQANRLYATSQQICIYAPGGKYRIAATAIPQFQGNGCIEGDGTNQTYFVIDKTYSGDVFSWDEAWFKTNYFQTGTFVTLSGQTAGPKIQGFTIVGDLSTVNIQNAFMFYDRVDFVSMTDVDVMGMKGRCFATGLTKKVSVAFMRESFLTRTRFWGCGTAELPAVDINSNGTATSDSTNEIDWTDLSILASAGRGLAIRNQGRRGVRGIRISNLRVEGPTGSSNAGDLIAIGDASYAGQVFDVSIDQLQTNGVSSGYSSLTLTASSASVQPYAITVKGNIGNGAGNGLNIQAGRSLRFDLSGIGTTGTEVTIGGTPLVGQDIVLIGSGLERFWTYNIDPSTIHAGFLRSDGTFRAGNPSSPATQALLARPHDNSAAGGLKPGVGAVDLQLDTSRDATRVAAGAYSVVVGGQGNRAGSQNTVQVGGQANLNNSQFGVGVGGQGNVLSSYGNTIVGGVDNLLTGVFGCIVGGSYASDRGRYGWCGYASGRFANDADAQIGTQVLRGFGNTASSIRLTSDGAAAGSANVVNLPSTAVGAYSLRITLTALDTTIPANTYAWSVPIAIVSKTGVAQSTTILTIGIPVVLATNSWTPSVSARADTINGGLDLSFTPPSSNIDMIHVTARVDSVEVQ